MFIPFIIHAQEHAVVGGSLVAAEASEVAQALSTSGDATIGEDYWRLRDGMHQAVLRFRRLYGSG